MDDEALIAEIETQRNLMIAVATGGPRIQSVDGDYEKRQLLISEELKVRGLRDPNTYPGLWAWYGKWSSGDLPSYQSRREYLSALYQRLIESLKNGSSGRQSEIFEEPTGWAKVDRGLGEIRERLEKADAEEQFQAIGLLCRETLISLAQTVFDKSIHITVDGIEPSDTDGKRMLEA